jgi:hypothetical protein
MLTEHPIYYQIPVDDLPDCQSEVLRILGYDAAQQDKSIRQMINEIDFAARQHVRIECGYRYFADGEIRIGRENISCLEITFESKSTIARQLRGSAGLIFFAVTLGSGFEVWLREFFAQGDPFSGYIADIIGSVRVEQAAEWLGDVISRQAQQMGLKCTNLFSPGYCGWDVREQHKLFSLFPEKFLGISLNQSALMTPIKSLSGVIGIGPNVKKLPHTCAFCDQPDCFMRQGKKRKKVVQ